MFHYDISICVVTLSNLWLCNINPYRARSDLFQTSKASVVAIVILFLGVDKSSVDMVLTKICKSLVNNDNDACDYVDDHRDDVGDDDDDDDDYDNGAQRN